MVKKEFTNPINNETVELDECKLSKSIEDYEGRSERIPNVDKNYVDLGIQFKLAQLINSKNVSFKNEIPIHVALKGHMGTGKDHDIEQFAAKLKYPYYRIPLSGEKIRLACIDTPELKGRRADPIPAKKARDFLNDLLVNEEVYIKRITHDRYRRTVAELYKNDINIQELIVQKGYGKIYKRYADQCAWTR